MSTRSTLDFLLYDWLKVDQLAARERFADHSRAANTCCWRSVPCAISRPALPRVSIV